MPSLVTLFHRCIQIAGPRPWLRVYRFRRSCDAVGGPGILRHRARTRLAVNFSRGRLAMSIVVCLQHGQ
jgi:hypothetical protein